MKVELLTYTPDGEKIIAAAAKLCYSKVGVDDILDGLTPEKCENFIKMLMSLGHESPVEHTTFTFAIEGVSRTLLAQLTRHRIASYSVQSQRYVDKENFEYIMPPAIKNIPEAKELFIKAMENDRETYQKINDILTNEYKNNGKEEDKAKKMAQEDARYVLSNACDTRIIMTMNVRSLYNFFSLRCCNRAQWEIRELACEMLKLCKEVSPILFAAAGPACIRGGCSEGVMTCGSAKEIREKFKNM